ncbi:MAG: WbqC family protein [Hydrogenophilaceae bacterium]|nr:WbqC family protein [Hydrogenophilaceae bacterium]
MILTAHQPVYLPWLGLFHKIALADMFISFNQVQYQPKDWNNRNQIKTQQGPIWLSVPVLRKGYLEKTISDLEINNSEPWARKHWKSLQVAYAKAPYFKRYADYFQDIYARRWERLVDLNETMLKGFLDILGIPVPVRSAGEWQFQGEKSDLVLDMCRQVGASDYIFGAMGRDYADIAAFDAAGIKAHFQDYVHPVYPQLHGDFVSHLSIVDLLFNCGDESRDILLSGNLTRADLLAGGG